jgi:hypothetical protein
MILTCANVLKLNKIAGILITLLTAILYLPFLNFIFGAEKELVKDGYTLCHWIFTGEPYSTATAYSKYLIQYVLGSTFLCCLIPAIFTACLTIPLFKVSKKTGNICYWVILVTAVGMSILLIVSPINIKTYTETASFWTPPFA